METPYIVLNSFGVRTLYRVEQRAGLFGAVDEI
jgi:hypothetical protein